MAVTYEPITTTTFNGSTSTVTFSSISSAYTDLRIVVNALSTNNALYMRFNSDSGTNYSFNALQGSAATISANNSTNESLINTGAFDTTYPSLILIDVFSYASAVQKAVLCIQATDTNSTGTYMKYTTGSWNSTTTVNSITLWASGSTNFASGGTITIYGIKAA